MPVELRCTDPQHFSSTFSAVRIGDVTVANLVSTGGGSARIHRTARHIRAADPEAYRLMLNVRGQSQFEQDGRTVHLRPGDLALFDSSLPFTARRSEEQHFVMVTMPRALVPVPRKGILPVTAVAWPTHSAIARSLSLLLHGLPGRGGEAAPAGPHLSAALTELTTVMLMEEFGVLDHARSGSSRTLRAAAEAFIEANLHLPGLAPSLVAENRHVSLRTLHRAFQDSGVTVADFIQTRRLERCRRDLIDPRLADVPVHAIAMRWGFVSASHFSRAFSREFGVTPHQFRLATIQQRPASARPDAALAGRGRQHEHRRPGGQ